VRDGVSMVAGMSVAEVLVFTRMAADKLMATKMDRPEDIERNPVNGRVYAALTNNSLRTGAPGTPTGPTESNPLNRSTVEGHVVATGSRNGHVIEWREARGDAGSEDFTWRIFLIAGYPDAPETYFAGYDKSQVSPISCPDNVAFDPAGNLWIATDGNALGYNDGFYPTPVTGPHRGQVKQFLTVPIGAEACGPWITEDFRTVFVAVQHPGEATGSTFEHPLSTWPDKLPTKGYPRPSVATVQRTDGGRIGT
jgi:secreted PhoX family phosphatase